MSALLVWIKFTNLAVLKLLLSDVSWFLTFLTFFLLLGLTVSVSISIVLSHLLLQKLLHGLLVGLIIIVVCSSSSSSLTAISVRHCIILFSATLSRLLIILISWEHSYAISTLDSCGRSWTWAYTFEVFGAHHIANKRSANTSLSDISLWYFVTFTTCTLGLGGQIKVQRACSWYGKSSWVSQRSLS